MPELFDVLTSEHGKVKGLLSRLEGTTERASKSRDQEFGQLEKALRPHMDGEESLFYPVLLKSGVIEAERSALEGIEEHKVARGVFEELAAEPKDTKEWSAKLKVFKELVEHHIEEEQGAVFKAAEKALDPPTLSQILADYQEQKKRVS